MDGVADHVGGALLAFRTSGHCSNITPFPADSENHNMRVIVRFSLNMDRGSKLRNQLKAILEKYGIMWTGRKTGTYEGTEPTVKFLVRSTSTGRNLPGADNMIEAMASL
jgi:hypothetical protein